MKLKVNLLLVISVLSFISCSQEEKTLKPSKELLFPKLEKSNYDVELEKIFAPFNTRVEYRYIKNLLPNDWYYITPIKEELIIPMSNFLNDYWIKPLENSSSRKFLVKTFPKKIVYVGSPAYQLDGTKVLGQAEGGTLIRFTECNYYNLNNNAWIRQLLHTAYHEYAHILHQTFKLPDEYRTITPNSYTRNGWRTVRLNNAISRGMVSGYGTSSAPEDFAELYSIYIISSQKQLNYLLNDEAISGTNPAIIKEISKRNEGRAHIRTKLQIMKKFLSKIGVDLDKTRQELQSKLS